jgi:hypothetical protein
MTKRPDYGWSFCEPCRVIRRNDHDRNHEPKQYAPYYQLLDQLETQVRTLSAALAESVRLQSHYAGLLNTYDGGQRIQFISADEWLERLAGLSDNAPERDAETTT